MGRSQIRILIVEDDNTAGQALGEAIRRAGYTVDIIRDPKEVDRQIKLHEYHIAIIDALLPITNGVEVGQQIHKSTHGATKILFMSGIFKDKVFIKDALTKVPALGFLTKPLDLDEVLSIIDQQTKDFLPDAKPPLQDLFLAESISNQLKVEAVNASEYIHGFELPWIYSLFVNSNMSGSLTLTPLEGSPWVVTFNNGRIVQIENNDAQSFFGQLLIENGYLSKSELDKFLNEESSQLLGQRLVEANAISSHITKVIQTEQLNIRLSQSLQEDQFKAQFISEDTHVAEDDAHINNQQISNILNDLIQSKVSYDWLKNYFTPWLEHCLEPAENFSGLENLTQLDLMQKFSKIAKIVNGKTSLNTILSVNSDQEEFLMKAVYLMLVERVCKFSDKKASRVSDKARITRLQKILKDIENQNYFEILGVTRRSPLNVINKSYHDLAKILHPDRLKKTAHPQVIELTDQIFTKITEAYTTLKHTGKRELYIKELDIGRSEAVFQAEALMDMGRKSLEARRYDEALKIFDDLIKSSHPPTDSLIYYIWAKLKAGLSVAGRKQEIEELTRMINKIPAEDRHSAPYFYAKGLLFISIENYDRALRCMENALAINPHFLPAKRDELRIKRVRESKAEKMSAKTLFMDMDLSTIFGGSGKDKKKKAK